MDTKIGICTLALVVALGLGMCAPTDLPREGQIHEEPARDSHARHELLPPEVRAETTPPDARTERSSPDRLHEQAPEARLEPTPEKTPDDSLAPPTKPAGLTAYITGNPNDAQVTPRGPGLILMGGSREVDDAFRWWKPLVKGGDVVILRTSGSNGYNDYLYREIGGVDSVVTLLVTSQALAKSAYVQWHLQRAEGIFLAGGDQSTYIQNWKGTPVTSALNAAYQRGAVVGGTSAGLAVLGQFVFGGQQGSITSKEALANPYARNFTLTRNFLSFAPLTAVITDSHFAARDRMGRLVTFLARLQQERWHTNPIGLGIDERTALTIDAKGKGTVMGSGAVYVLKSSTNPTRCSPGQALDFAGLSLTKHKAGDTITFPQALTPNTNQPTSLSAKTGKLQPANPY